MLQKFAFVLTAMWLVGCGSPNTPGSSSSESSSSTSNSTSSVASSSNSSAAQARCDAEQSRATKETAQNALEQLFIQKDTSAIQRYWGEPYLQHNPIADSGVDAFSSFMSGFVVQPSFSYELLRIYAECDLAIVQGRYSQTGVIFDMFRVEDGKLVEHWDSDSNQASPTEGPTEATDQEATHENRETVQQFYTDILIPNQTSELDDYIANSAVIRRGSRMGPQGFADHLQQNGIRYQQVHYDIADGNFVFVLSEATLNGTAYALYDLYRLENGLIVEHWDSRRRVPSSTASGLGIF